MWSQWLRDNGRWSLWHRETSIENMTVCTLQYEPAEFTEKLTQELPDFYFMCSDCLNERAAQQHFILDIEEPL